jgi:uncharacterized membrane protein
MKVTEVIIPKEITILIVFCVALNLLRVTLFGSYDLIYLLWNIFLAFVPFFIASTLAWHVHHAKVSRPEIILGGLFWLLLFPNAPYIITDFTHLGESATVPMWFDILVIFASAWAALQFGFYSLLHIEELLLLRYRALTVQLLLLPIIAFASFGIYLGRFLRFNSWDIVADSRHLASVIWDIGLGRIYFPEAYSFPLVFFCFLWVTYTSWKLSRRTVSL